MTIAELLVPELSVYLRLNNISVPGVYGPSADES